MLSTPHAPHPADVIVQIIRDHRRSLDKRMPVEHYTSRETTGQFKTVGGALVETQIRVRFSHKYTLGRDPQRMVEVGAVAKCYGHGCPDPLHEEPFTAEVPLDADADETATAGPPLVQAAGTWAQTHADHCRAVPYRES